MGQLSSHLNAVSDSLIECTFFTKSESIQFHYESETGFR